MGPFAAMMIFKGAQTIMDHQAAQMKAAEYNSWKYKKDLAIKKRLETQAGFARQAIADTDMMRVRQGDIESEGLIDSQLQQMKVVAAMKASGLPQGQSTDGLLRLSMNEVLKDEAKFLKDLDMKAEQLDYRNREIQQGMEMAWLDAKAQIAGTGYQRGPGTTGLMMGLTGAAFDAYTFDKQVS